MVGNDNRQTLLGWCELHGVGPTCDALFVREALRPDLITKALVASRF
jgi:hypothetical protein